MTNFISWNMSEALARTKKVRAGHRSSATRLMHQLDGEYEIDDGPTLNRLMQCKLSLNEKLDRLHTLDEEILALVEDEGIADEIEQADQFKERIQQVVFRVEHEINVKKSSTVALFWLASYMTDCSQNTDLKYNRIRNFQYLHLV